MVFSILQRNNPLSIIIFPLLILGLWASYITEPQIIMQYYDIAPMPLYKPFLSIYKNNYYLGMLIMFAIMGINILIFSRINSSLRLIEKRSSFYLLLYVIFSAIFPEYQQFNPLHFSLLWILLGIYSIFKLYKNEYELRSVYESGFFFSVAGLFYANAFFFAIIIFIGMISLIPFNWRQWVAAIFGLLTPIFFITSWAFMFNKFPYLISIVEQNTIIWHKTLSVEIIDLGFVALIGLVFTASLFFAFSGVLKKIAIQKYYFLLFIFLVIIVFSYLAVPSVGIDAFFFALIPFIFFISNYMLNMKIWVVPEFLSTIIIAYIILLQFIS